MGKPKKNPADECILQLALSQPLVIRSPLAQPDFLRVKRDFAQLFSIRKHLINDAHLAFSRSHLSQQMEQNSNRDNSLGVYMLGGQKLWAIVLCFCLLVIATAPAMAADPQITKNDLKGISPQHHKYLFAVLGGAAVGAGVGVLLGSGNDITKGLMIGGGGMSALYLHSHRRDSMNGWRNWAYMASYGAFGGGMGWTLCGCDDGLVAGTLIGGGATAAWLSSHPQRVPQTASGPRP